MDLNKDNYQNYENSAPEYNSAPVYNSTPEYNSAPVYDSAPATERKSKLAAGLLGIFLGSLGIHNFYLGYTKKAILQISLTLGCCVLAFILYFLAGLLTFIYIGIVIYPIAILVNCVPGGISIWGLVEGIMILAGGIKTDGRGIPLKE